MPRQDRQSRLDQANHLKGRIAEAFVEAIFRRAGYLVSQEGTVHIEQVLEYNEDPSYLRDLLLYRLTIEAQKRIDKSPLSKREIIRRLGTSPAQLYRLLDQTNYRKSVDQLVSLLQILDCDVDFVVRAKTA